MANSKRMEVTIVFKSGASFTVKVDDFTVKRNVVGSIIEVTWTAADPSIIDLNLKEIVAVFGKTV